MATRLVSSLHCFFVDIMAPGNGAHGAQGRLLSLPVTPAKDRDRHPFPSQSPLRQPTLSNLPSSTSSSIQISPQTMSVDALLKQHAAAPDPRTAALEQAVNDRNVLSSQNAQLWKLIEKQRAGYNQILKELERIRGERDGYKSKLMALDALPNGSERRQKSSMDRATRPSLDLPTDSPTAVSLSQTQSRFLVQRHNSEDTGLTPPHPPLRHSSRSLEPLSARSADTTPTSQTLSGLTPQTPRTPRPSASQAVSSRQDEHAGDVTTLTGKPVTNGQYSPVRPNPRKSSLAESVSSIVTTNSSAFSHSTPSISVSSSSQSGSSPTLYTPVQNISITGATTVEPRFGGLFSGHTSHYPPNGPSMPTVSTSASQNQMLARLAPVPEDRHLSRDSRISLPEEAKQYITNMTDSPITSPGPDSSSSKSQPGTSIYPPRSSSADSGQESEFLDMGDEESNEDLNSEDAEDDTAAAKDSGSDIHSESQAPPAQPQLPHHERDLATHQPFHPPNFNQFSSQSSNSSREDIGFVQSKRSDKSRVAPEEFPLPPPSHQFHRRQNQQQNSASQDVQHYHGHHSPSSQTPAMQQPVTPTLSAKVSHADGFGSNDSTQSPETSQVPSSIPAAFRALPLLSSDLPNTTVSVSHSFVRPNDRGKEVLSFVVFVNPGNGKDGWKVEKMYSDVLSLDQRVRSCVGKGVGKKIANLPEGKLWKDHAPAKVDQRKAVLEHYLQSLIRLPVKNNDEVIAFFTSDIVREQKQPVMQIGHKEGYLTKRGKNFGGWKTRFFVLQGPVLEYYDCRGGTHLGSITITGAQIARQHKTEKPPSNDDEKEYRHAFLIVEAKKGPGGNSARHVLCAESDEDRDSWVEMLVRYYTGTYSEDLVLDPPSGLTSVHSNSSAAASNTYSQPRTSTSSDTTSPVGPRTKAIPRTIREEISRGPAIPISQLPPDPTNVKLFQPVPTSEDYARSSSPSKSMDIQPSDQQGPSNNGSSEVQKRMIERSGLGLPSSLPDPSPLSSGSPILQENVGPNSGTRANSELGHYSDLQDNRAGKRQISTDQRPKDDGRKVFLPGGPSSQTPPERAPTPDKFEGKAKISGPMNGAPIPAGFKFGSRDPPSADSSASDRREKAKSRSFWGFGKGEKQPQSAPRAVFGVPLEEALDVSQICNLPSIVFRSIQYLETKMADQEEGIYRLSGSSAVIKSLKDRFNNEGDVDLLGSDEYWDPHAIAGLLKSYLRELPESILTRDLHLRFLAVIDFVDPQERIKELSQLIADLPLVNYSLLRALTAHLILIVQNSNVNKMTMRNVGIVFSPTLGIPAGVFSLMLGEFNRVFNVDAARDTGPADQNSELLRRNSQRYSDAAADQLLGLTGRTLSPPAEDTQSEGDDSSIHEESGTETTENEATVDSSSSSPIGIRINAPDPPDTPVAKFSKAQNAASSKGLNLIVSTSERGNRHSRMIGLPLSPRPQPSPSRPE